MKISSCPGWLSVLLGMAVCLCPAAAQDPPPVPDIPQPQEGVEVLARGPVHEGYAEPTEVRPQPSPLVNRQPPDPIEEVPPEQRPEGENVQWIPGYWSYDPDAQDFLWVSGFWRTPPPGRQWVPGGWQQVENGWHWVPGFWAPVGLDQLDYLPMPPPSVDQGPSVPTPQANSTYVPGCWVFRQSRYLWRPGFWVPFHPGWVWIPAHYLWTPSGCLFVEGYWDHPLGQRGLLFAPVRLAAGLLRRARWSYTPQYVVRPDFLLGALFVQPAGSHYYFGDYFNNRSLRAGFVPWIDYRIGRIGWDPNFAYYRHQFAGQENWERGLRDLYRGRFRGDIPRPPATLVQQSQVIRTITKEQSVNAPVVRGLGFTHLQNVSVLSPLTQVHNTPVTGLAGLAGLDPRAPKPTPDHVLRLQALSAEQHAHQQRAALQLRSLAQERKRSEANLLSQGPPAHVTDRPRQMKLDLSRAVPPSVPAARPGPEPARRVAPPAPVLPRHEERAIPHHEPPRPPAPPRQPPPPAPHPAPASAPHPTPPAPPPAPPPPPHKKK